MLLSVSIKQLKTIVSVPHGVKPSLKGVTFKGKNLLPEGEKAPKLNEASISYF